MSECGISFTPCRLGRAISKDGVELHYEVYGLCDGSGEAWMLERPKVIMIMGIASGCGGWEPQLEDMLYPPGSSGKPAMDICVFDNRGIGNSSVPTEKTSYSTRIMADDVATIMSTLGWEKVHLIGFSMGGMIATKFASTYPEKLNSLSLLGVTEGGMQVLPRSWRALKYGLRILTANSMEERAWFDLKFHFTKSTLRAKVDNAGTGLLRRDCLYEEYLEAHRQVLEQPREGLDGQMHACWNHSVRSQDIARIQSGDFPVLVIHGRQDLVAAPKYGRRIAQKFGAKFVEVDGAHLITRECGHEVNQELIRIVMDRSTVEHRARHILSAIMRRGDSARSEVSISNNSSN